MLGNDNAPPASPASAAKQPFWKFLEARQPETAPQPKQNGKSSSSVSCKETEGFGKKQTDAKQLAKVVGVDDAAATIQPPAVLQATDAPDPIAIATQPLCITDTRREPEAVSGGTGEATVGTVTDIAKKPDQKVSHGVERGTKSGFVRRDISTEGLNSGNVGNSAALKPAASQCVPADGGKSAPAQSSRPANDESTNPRQDTRAHQVSAIRRGPDVLAPEVDGKTDVPTPPDKAAASKEMFIAPPEATASWEPAATALAADLPKPQPQTGQAIPAATSEANPAPQVTLATISEPPLVSPEPNAVATDPGTNPGTQTQLAQIARDRIAAVPAVVTTAGSTAAKIVNTRLQSLAAKTASGSGAGWSREASVTHSNAQTFTSTHEDITASEPQSKKDEPRDDAPTDATPIRTASDRESRTGSQPLGPQVSGDGSPAKSDFNPQLRSSQAGATATSGKPDTGLPYSGLCNNGLPNSSLIERFQHTELHFGMQTGEFGRVEVRTSLDQHAVAAKILVERPELGRMMQTELPSLQRRMSDLDIPLTKISVYEQSAAMSGDADRHPQAQDWTAGRTTGAPGLEMDAEPTLIASVEQVDCSTGLSIRI